MAKPTLRAQLEQAQEQIAELNKAQEAVISDYTMLARQVEELQFIDLNNIVGSTDEVLPQAKRVQTILRIRRLRHENPMAKQAIKLILRFVLGKGIAYEVRDANIKRFVDDFWTDPVNQAVLTSHFGMVTSLDDTLTDGEQFIVMFDAPESPYVRLGHIPMEEITQILYDPDNRKMPVWYRRTFREQKWDPKLNNGQGGWAIDLNAEPKTLYYRDWRVDDQYLADVEERGLRIPKEKQGKGKIKHRMVNPVYMRSGYRGVSELFASREWFRVFKEFMEDRGAINAAANALAYQRKIAGGPAAVAALSGKLGGVQVTPGAEQPLTPSSFRRPGVGSILDTNQGVDYKSLRADTGAPGAARDAEMIRGTAVSGVGMPDYYFGATNNALAGAQSAEISVVKAFEEFQTYMRNDLIELTQYVISIAQGVPVGEAHDDARAIAWVFPPISTQDLVKWITAIAQWTQQVAPGNRVVRERAIRAAGSVLGIPDLEMLWDEIEQDEKRISTEQDEAKKQQQEAAKAQQQAALAGALGKVVSDSPSVPKPLGQKAGGQVNASGASPDLQRAAAGKGPREGSTGPRSKRQ